MADRKTDTSSQPTAAMVDLALAVTAAGDGTACPDSETLARFAEQDLSEEQRAAIVRHLDQCDSCRAQWLAVASVVDTPAFARPAPRAASLTFTGFARSGLSVVAIAACLLLVVYFGRLGPGVPGFMLAVDHGYEQLFLDTSVQVALADLAEDSAPTLGSRGLDSPADCAVDTGLRQGVERLRRGEIDPYDSLGHPAMDYLAAVGRWQVLLMASLDLQPLPGKAFWLNQAETAAGLGRSGETRLGHDGGERLDSLFVSIAESCRRVAAGDSGATAKLRRQLRGLEQAARAVDIALQ